MGSLVKITKLDHTSRPLFTYSGELEQFSAVQVVVRCLWTMPTPVTVGYLTFSTGDILLEHFYRDKWFNIFKLYDSRGQLKGWYCNFAETITMSDSIIRWRDLALDLIVAPNRDHQLMDEDEFEAMHPSEELRVTAQKTLATLRRWVTKGYPPFIHDALEFPQLLK
jgi:hypothetical protein